MLLELHTHTNRHSRCSGIDPVSLLRHVAAKGLQGIVITEHHYLWSAQEIEMLRGEAGVEKHFLVLAAQEVGTDIGHVLVYGAGETITDILPLTALRARYPNAALVWAHPYRKGRVPERNNLVNPLLNGIEVFSLNHTMRENYLGLKDWHRYKFTATSGSDTHAEESAGVFPTYFDHDVADITGLATEIRAGRCRPFIKEIPRAGSDLTVTDITIGTKGDDEHRHRIIVKNFTDEKKWERARESAKLTETLYHGGFAEDLFRVPRVIEINEQEKLLIEEGQRGKNLYDLMTTVSPDTAAAAFALAARWLAALHRRSDPSTDDDKISLRTREDRRLAGYERAFTDTHNPHAETARRMIAVVSAFEQAVLRGPGKGFVQCHGDYHPKNIIIGQDLAHDPDTRFISVIDFNSAIRFLPAFDIGYFLAQFAGQFSGHPEITARHTARQFMEAYRQETGKKAVAFGRQVPLFTLRGNLSIAAYYIKVGKGESPEMDALIARSSALLHMLT